MLCPMLPKQQTIFVRGVLIIAPLCLKVNFRYYLIIHIKIALNMQ